MFRDTTMMASRWRPLMAFLCLFLQFQVSVALNNNIVNRREWLQAGSLAGLSILAPSSPSHAADAAIPSTTTPYLFPGAYDPSCISTAPQAGRFYFPTLTPPFRNRATFRHNLGRNAWAFEQLLTFVNVTATIRTNVIRLKSGGLWVHSPQWPTEEFVSLLNDIGAPVEHVVLPCNALEHKAPMNAFLQKYPDASVWISPGQYGPFGTCGMKYTSETSKTMGHRVDGIFGRNDNNPNKPPPWSDEFDIETLYVELPENAGPVSEVAFCHRPTKTLIATDAVVYIQDGPAPEIFSTYFDKVTTLEPTFWPRTVLQSVFLPLRQDNDQNYPGYEALKERLVRAPILRAFADARSPQAVREWVTNISTKFDFDRILTSHFASPIAATPRDFQNAFAYLFDDEDSLSKLPPIACQDWQLLESLNQGIEENKLGAPVVFDYARGCKSL